MLIATKYFLKNMAFCLVICFFSIISVLTANGQTILTGSIAEEDTDTPLPYATIELIKLPDSTRIDAGYADNNGEFELRLKDQESAFIKVSFIGYQTFYRELKADDTKQDNINLGKIGLVPEVTGSDEVLIEGRILQSYQKGDKKVYRTEQYKVAQGGSASDLVGQLPSVSTDALGQLRLRGTDDFLLLVDGNPIQGDPSLLLSQLPADQIESIEVITNPGVEYDSQGAGGVINVITKGNKLQGYTAQISGQMGLPGIDTYDNLRSPRRYGGQVLLGYRTDKWDVVLSANFFQKDLSGFRISEVWNKAESGEISFFPATGERSYIRQEYGFRFKVNYHPKENHTISVGNFTNFKRQKRRADLIFTNYRTDSVSSQDTLSQYTYFNNNFEFRDIDFYLGSIDYEWKINESTSLTNSALFEYSFFSGPTQNREFQNPESSEILNYVDNIYESPLYGFRYRLDYQQKIHDFTFKTGLQFRHVSSLIDFQYNELDTNTNQFVSVDSFTNVVNFSRNEYAAYFQGKYSINNWRIDIGLRAELARRSIEHDETNGPLNFNLLSLFPNFSISYKKMEDWEFKAGYSRRINRNTIYQLNPFPEREHSYVLERGDDELRPELSDVVEIGGIYNNDDGSISLTGYFRRTNNVINRFNSVFNDTIQNRFYSNVGVGIQAGLDVAFNWRFTDWLKVNFGGLFYQYWLDGSLAVGNIKQNVNTQAFQYSLNPNISFAFLKGTELQIGINYLSKRVTAQGEESEFYNPFLTLQRKFFDNQLMVQYQWRNIGLGGFINSNRQQLTTSGPNFFNQVNYIYERDVMLINISWTFQNMNTKINFQESELLEREL